MYGIEERVVQRQRGCELESVQKRKKPKVLVSALWGKPTHVVRSLLMVRAHVVHPLVVGKYGPAVPARRFRRPIH